MVVGVHAVEAYLLYPQIYAYRLKLHPLTVLVGIFIKLQVCIAF
jgi:predicted PurR-regulated permease PerM